MIKEAQDAKENAEQLANQKKDITEQIRYNRRLYMNEANN